jgi:peptidoglycan DL-endopeptidase LytE
MNLNLIKLSSTKLLLLLFIVSINVFSQEKYIKHTVAKGESFYSISKKYKVSVEDIEEVNLQYRDNLKPNAILLIPNPKLKKAVSNDEILHEVLPKETLYGISKKYNVTIDAIKKANPNIDSEGLKVGTVLKFFGTRSKVENASENALQTKSLKSETEPIEIAEQEVLTHEVLPKETKYGISRKYKISIATLEKLNPEIGNELSVGMKLKVRKLATSEVKTEEVTETKSEPKQTKNENISPSGEPYAVLIPIYEKADLPDLLVNTASENLGTAYRGGGKDKGGFDCSGLMIYTFGKYDVKLPRTSSEQSQFGTTISAAESQKGDLIFFSTNGSGSINHVGMITEVIGDEIKFIHSSSSNGVIISSNQESYYAKCFRKIARVLK